MGYNIPDILYSKIRIKRSLVAGEVPSSLELGELAINIKDKKIWVGNEQNTAIELAEKDFYTAGNNIYIDIDKKINFDPQPGSIPISSLEGKSNGYLRYFNGNWIFQELDSGIGVSGFVDGNLLFSCIGAISSDGSYQIVGGDASTLGYCSTSSDLGSTFFEGYGIGISANNEISIDTTIFTDFPTSILPTADLSYDLGSSSFRWNNVICGNLDAGDINLSNENTSGNSIDGTTGNWTIQEGENDLFLINNKNGKRYKFVLSEIL